MVVAGASRVKARVSGITGENEEWQKAIPPPTGGRMIVESVDKPGSVASDHSSATGVTTCL